jgi:glycosyl hydrolase family 79
VLAVGLAFAISADGDERSAVPSPAEPVPAEVSVSLAEGRPGAPVARDFLGLSFELSSAAQIAAYAERGNFVRMLRSLGPGVLRLGGASADTRVAWSDRRTPRPAWASSVLEPADLRRLRRLAAASGWRVLLTLGLAHYDPRAAAREATAAHRILGNWLAGIEVGNEPDSYGRHALRPLPWTASLYEQQVSAYRRAIARRAPGIALAGPGVSGSRAFRSWGAAEARRQRPQLLTGHHYPLRCDSVPAPTIEDLLSQRTRALEALSLRRYLAVARAHRRRFRMDETNTVSCGGVAGVSDTFASALWAVGYITQAMAADAAGVNLQGNPANCRGYSPVCAASPALLADGTLRAQPEWYALLLTRALVGARPLATRILAPANPNVAVAALRRAGGVLQFAIVEDDPAGGPGAAVRLHVGRALRMASVLRLTAPAPGARTGVRLGGQAVAGDGSWRAGHVETLSARGGVLALQVPAASAVLVTVSRR